MSLLHDIRKSGPRFPSLRKVGSYMIHTPELWHGNWAHTVQSSDRSERRKGKGKAFPITFGK